MAAMPVRFER
jgi:hypothetical protein